MNGKTINPDTGLVWQAKDIEDGRMLSIVIGLMLRSNVEPKWTYLGDYYKALPDVPYKVVLAKLRILIKRGLVEGCGCGCRGDFVITQRGTEVATAWSTRELEKAGKPY